MVHVIDVQLALMYHQIEEVVSSKFHALQGSIEIQLQVFVSIANHILFYPKIKLDVFKRLVLVTWELLQMVGVLHVVIVKEFHLIDKVVKVTPATTGQYCKLMEHVKNVLHTQ